MPLAALLLAATVPVVPLAPVGPWMVEAEEDTCLLSHSYGTPADRVTVGFQPVFNQETMDVIVISKLGDKDQRMGDAKIIAGIGGKLMTGSYSSVQVLNKLERFTRITTTHDLIDAMRTAETLEIKAKPVNITVQLASFNKAMKACEGCQAGLLKAWGVDPASMDPDRAPKPRNVLSYFSSASYPSEAVRSGIIGRVLTVLQVDAAGAVTNCRVVASAGKVLNEGTCRQAMKIKFEPGRGLDVKPAASIFVLPVRWVL